jgi:hypothetical protein
MTGVLTTLWLAVLLAWVLAGLGGLVLPPPQAVAAGLAAGAVAAVLFRDTIVLRGLVALLGSFRAVLPVLALRHLAGMAGIDILPFTTVELAAFLVAYVFFLAAATTALPANVYRLGYAPWPVAGMVLAVCAYGMAQGSLFIPLVAVAGQAFWVAGIGSSNWFDHVLHAALVPVAAVVLLERLLSL